MQYDNVPSPHPAPAPALSDAEFSRRLVAYQPALYKCARELFKHQADVEDLVQETCLTLWQNRDKYVVDGSFFAWARTCMLRKHYNIMHRNHHVHYPIIVDDLATEDEHEALRFTTHIPIDHSTPHSQLEAEEVRNTLEQRLPPHYGLVLKLKMLGYTNDEVSTLMHVSHEGIRKRTFAARELLRRHFFLPKRSK